MASSSGSAPSATTRLATTGMIPLAVATLLANSVIMITMATIASATMGSGTAASGSSDWPSQSASPNAVIPAASARPPPNIMITPHGARSASCHTSIGRPVPSGSRNSDQARRSTAIVPSVQRTFRQQGSSQRLQHPQHEGDDDDRHQALFGHGPGRCVSIVARAAATSNGCSPVRCTLAMIQAASGMPQQHHRHAEQAPFGKADLQRRCVSSSRATAMALVGEPTMVPSPPIEAAKAMPIGNAPESPSRSSGEQPPPASTASAIGIMISAVEVLEIIIERIAADIMKASSNRELPPLRADAIRGSQAPAAGAARCARSPGRGTHRPESGTGSANNRPTPFRLASSTPANGRTRKGSKAVAVSGIASVIHQAAISITSPATGQASGGMDAGAGRMIVARKPASPTTSPIVFALMNLLPPVSLALASRCSATNPILEERPEIGLPPLSAYTCRQNGEGDS